MADESVTGPASLVEIIRREAADLVKVKVMKQGGLLRTLAMVELAAAAGLRVVVGHGFGLTLSTLAEAAVAAVSDAVIDGCEAVGPLKMAGDVVVEPVRLDSGVHPARRMRRASARRWIPTRSSGTACTLELLTRRTARARQGPTAGVAPPASLGRGSLACRTSSEIRARTARSWSRSIENASASWPSRRFSARSSSMRPACAPAWALSCSISCVNAARRPWSSPRRSIRSCQWVNSCRPSSTHGAMATGPELSGAGAGSTLSGGGPVAGPGPRMPWRPGSR